jgi:tetratricopeptide (TPR) repeat protein
MIRQTQQPCVPNPPEVVMPRRALIAIATLLWLTPHLWASDASDQSRKLVADGKLTDALAVVDTALNADASDRESRFQRAWVLGLLGRRADSDRDFAALVTANPQDGRPFEDHGSLAFANGDFHTAIADYSHAMVRGIHEPLVWHYRGLSFLAVGNLPAAGVDFKYWIQADPNSAEAYARRAFVEWRGNDSDAEKADVAQAKTLDAAQADRWDQIDDGAEIPFAPLKPFAPLLPLDCPEHEQAIALNNAGLQIMNVDQELAIRKFEAAEQADQPWGVPWCNHSLALLVYVTQNGGTLTHAFGYLIHGYMLDPTLINIYEPKMLTYEHALERMKGDFDSNEYVPTAEGQARINAITTYADAMAEGARIRATNQRATLGDALLAYYRALQIDPLSSDARVARAKIFRNDFSPPRNDMAVYDLTAAIRVHPDWTAFRLRAACWSDARVFDSAIDDISEAIGMKPDLPAMYFERAFFTLANGGNADDDFTTAQKLDPDHFDQNKQQVMQQLAAVQQQVAQAQAWAEQMAAAQKMMRVLDRQAAYQRAGAAEAAGDMETAREIRNNAH